MPRRVGFFLYDASTYRLHSSQTDVDVSALAINPRRGGPKNLPILESHLDDDDTEEMLTIAAIHDERGYLRIREALSTQYALSVREPNIQVWEADIRGDRSLTLHHVQDRRRPLAKSVYPVMRHLHQLWGFPVKLVSMEGDETVRRYHWPLPEGDSD